MYLQNRNLDLKKFKNALRNYTTGPDKEISYNYYDSTTIVFIKGLNLENIARVFITKFFNRLPNGATNF